MQVLVTGGSGFIGLYIVEQLVERGDEVRVLSRRALPDFERLNVKHFQGDLHDRELIETAVQGVDLVFHVAALTGIWGTWRQYFDVNVQATRDLIAACQRHHVPRLVFTSSPSVIFGGESHENVDESHPYPERYLAHYPHSKAIAEQEVLAANGQEGLMTAAIRPHLVWGKRDTSLLPRIVDRARAGRLRKIGDGENLISVAYVENVAAAHLQLADALGPTSPTAGQVYFINDPEPVKLWDWLNRLLEEVGEKPITRSISAGAAHRIGHVMESVYGLLRIKADPPMTRFVAAQLSKHHYYSIEKAKRDFNYTPIVSIEEGFEKWKPELRALAQAKHGTY